MVRRLSYERGSALTEFALIMPLLIGVFYGSIYLVDVGLFRLKSQEVARYSTWAFTQASLSDYESEEARHDQRFSAARQAVSSEVGSLYLDLDAARTRLLPGAARQSVSAVLLPGVVRQDAAPVLPEVATVGIPAPNITVSLVLSAIGLGGTTNDIAAGFFKRAGLNSKGLVTARASVRVLPPIRAADRERMSAVSRLGGARGLDVESVVSSQQGREIRDDGQPVSGTLLVDSWKVASGFSALPSESVESRRSFAHVVERFHDEAPKVLPGGGIIGGLLGIVGAKDAGRYVASRPYLDARSCSGVNRERFNELAGQFNPFRRSGVPQGQLQEPGAVTSFETLPLFDDPGDLCSEMLEALNARGNHFMGCDESQERRCR
ncbi:MAG: hypothetical protein AAFQ82_04200 [Myxococcota bacterium]